MANSNVKNASDKCEKRTSTRKATHTTRQGRQAGSSSKNKSQVRTHTHERQLALGLCGGGAVTVGVCLLEDVAHSCKGK